MKKLYTIALAFLVLCLSCNKDDSPSPNNPNQDPDPSAFAENFGSEIQRNFLGKVIDTNNNPIQGVNITIGSKSAQTDANGIFIINSATVNQRFGYVKAEKPGYLHGSRAVIPSEGTNKVTIMLLEENVVGTTNSGTTETITLPNGASVALQGNYKKEDGTAYTGSVNVIMHHLDPSDDDMKYKMPGMLYAANAQNQERMLQTYGMLAVELKGSGGEALNLADGSTAEIKMPLDATFLATAPTTIPLWHFDETNGYWVEDGQATLIGNAYIGTVTHFSFWNCDIPAEAVNLCITVQDANGNPLTDALIWIESNVYGVRGGYTNNDGEVCGFVPSNETLVIRVTAYTICGNENLYESSIGPFSEDTSITINLAENGSYVTQTVVGNFTTCNGEPVNEGYVMLTHNYRRFFSNLNDGAFEFNFLACADNDEFKLYGVDFENLQETDSITYTFTPPITSTGTLAACNTVEEFITYQVDDHPVITYIINLYTYNEGNGYSLIVGSDSNIPDTGNINLDIYGNMGIGIYNTLAQQIGFYFNDNNGDTLVNTSNIDITFNVSAILNVNGSLYTDINFTGTYLQNGTETHTITGTMHVK